jgi:hypothetical protein
MLLLNLMLQVWWVVHTTVEAPRTSASTQNSENPPISETVLQKPEKHCTAFYFLAPKGRVLYLTPKFGSVVEYS